MPFELSPQEMREPLRVIMITAPGSTTESLIAMLHQFGNDTRFAIYVGPQTSPSADRAVAAYRSDIIFRGRLIPTQSRIELGVYRTFNRVEAAAIDHGVAGLRDAMEQLPGARFQEQVLVRGDDKRLDPRIPISAVRAVDVFYDEAQREAFQRQIRRFAAANRLAIRIRQLSTDPRRYAASIYGDGFVFLGNAGGDAPFGFGAYRTGDRSAPDELFDRLFDALRRSLQEVDSVKVVDRPLKR